MDNKQFFLTSKLNYKHNYYSNLHISIWFQTKFYIRWNIEACTKWCPQTVELELHQKPRTEPWPDLETHRNSHKIQKRTSNRHNQFQIHIQTLLTSILERKLKDNASDFETKVGKMKEENQNIFLFFLKGWSLEWGSWKETQLGTAGVCDESVGGGLGSSSCDVKKTIGVCVRCWAVTESDLEPFPESAARTSTRKSNALPENSDD